MKRKYVLTGVFSGLLLLILVIGTAWNYTKDKEPHKKHMLEPPHRDFLNLNEDQEGKIASFRLQLTKETTPIRNEVDILEAKLKALSIGDEVDEKSVYRLMDEISALKLKISKSKFQFNRKFRAVLTEDQKVVFDANNHMFKGEHKEGGFRHGVNKHGKKFKNGTNWDLPENHHLNKGNN